jgi:hypothetical protein
MNILCAFVCEVVKSNQKLWEMIRYMHVLHLQINSPLSAIKDYKEADEITMLSGGHHSYTF